MMLAPSIDEGASAEAPRFCPLPLEFDGRLPTPAVRVTAHQRTCEDVIAANDECDKEVSDITTKLRRLQERRCKMVQRWTASGDETGSERGGGGNCPAGEPPPAENADCSQTFVVSSEWPPWNYDPAGSRGTPPRRNGYEKCEDSRTDGSPSDRMNESMLRLRQELASLFSQDNAIFEQLLALRQTIAQLKQQSYDDLYEDAEVTYLSSNGGSFRYGHGGSVRRSAVEGYSCFTPPCEQSSEDSGVSMESSGLSSPSLSPSPTAAAALQMPAAQSVPADPDPAFRRNDVTFPPSRNRQLRFGGSELSKSKQSSVSTPSGVDFIGGGGGAKSERAKPPVAPRSRLSFAGTPPVLLVRSRSITFLPRGVLVRKEDAGESARPTDGEVFV